MSTNIFVVCWTRDLCGGEQGVCAYTEGVRGKQRFGKNAGPGRGHIGLGRALSKLGFCSRSHAFELIRAGRVRLKGVVSKNPEAGVRLGEDRIELDGVEIKRTE